VERRKRKTKGNASERRCVKKDKALHPKKEKERKRNNNCCEY
jgi:hypothetical protein